MKCPEKTLSFKKKIIKIDPLNRKLQIFKVLFKKFFENILFNLKLYMDQYLTCQISLRYLYLTCQTRQNGPFFFIAFLSFFGLADMSYKQKKSIFSIGFDMSDKRSFNIADMSGIVNKYVINYLKIYDAYNLHIKLFLK